MKIKDHFESIQWKRPKRFPVVTGFENQRWKRESNDFLMSLLRSLLSCFPVIMIHYFILKKLLSDWEVSPFSLVKVFLLSVVTMALIYGLFIINRITERFQEYRINRKGIYIGKQFLNWWEFSGWKTIDIREFNDYQAIMLFPHNLFIPLPDTDNQATIIELLTEILPKQDTLDETSVHKPVWFPKYFALFFYGGMIVSPPLCACIVYKLGMALQMNFYIFLLMIFLLTVLIGLTLFFVKYFYCLLKNQSLPMKDSIPKLVSLIVFINLPVFMICFLYVAVCLIREYMPA
jgi:MFS family permease